ncbi:MAG: chitobiase/beta-hexosaminidase C-terminal domain-containing protein [Bacteroidales bacterium]|nr:chitobiase/beta-hexosaminidase C-terminal domain-containing protein [Bacteroidales bacterium]
MKKTLSQRFFLPLCLLTLFGILGGSHAWAEDFSQTYSYGDLTGWSLTNYSDQKSYYLILSSGDESVATISGIFTGKTISSAVKITINSATYGNGTNPSSSTYAIYNDADCTTAVVATQGGKLPTSSTYTNVTYTVSQADASALTKDLAIKFTKPSKQIRLKSIKVEFSYSSGGGEMKFAPTISTQPQDAIYELNAKAAPLTIEASGMPAPTFQWYSNTENNNTHGTIITGATEANYTPATTTSGTVYYYCIATNTQGSATSDVATITVKPSFTGSVLTMSATSDANIKFVEGSSSSTGAVWSNSTPLTYNGITLSGSVTSGTTYSYYDGTQVRFYTNNNLVITPASGITIEKIEIVRNSTTEKNNGTIACSGLTASSENTTTNTNVFIGNATTAVTFTASKQCRFTAIKVYYSGSAAGIVNAPVFNVSEGTYFEAQTVKVTDYDNGLKYYYTIDGTDPKLNASFQPTGTTQSYNDATGVSISSTTTLKMIATDKANVSSITTATYTISAPDATTIMGLRNLGAGTYSVRLTDAIVTYVNGKNGYVEDATGGLMLYATNTLKVGDKINGPVDVVLIDYNGTDEATTFDVSSATITSDNALPLQDLTIENLITGDGMKTYESMRVRIKNAVVKDAIVSRNGTISQGEKSIALREGVNGCLSTTCMMNVNSMGNVIGYPTTYTSGGNTTLQISAVSADAVEETGYNLAVSAAGYATYFNSANAFTMPADATGYVWFEGKIEKAYNHSEDVPANEPLVIEAAAGNYPLWFTTSTKTSWKKDSMNDLEGTDFETDLTDDANYYFYGLSLNKSSEAGSVGFYWMNTTGAAFTNGAHKAYLKLAKSVFAGSQAVNGFPFNGSTTGIEQIEAGADAKNVIYDLSGRRVNKAAKGIYILNGKKVLVK